MISVEKKVLIEKKNYPNMVILRKKNSKLIRRLVLPPKLKTKNPKFLRLFKKKLLKKNLKGLFEKKVKRRIRPFSIARGRRYRGYKNYLRHKFFKRRSIRRAKKRFFRDFASVILQKRKKIRRFLLKRRKKVIYVRRFNINRTVRRIYRKYIMRRYILKFSKCTLESLRLQKIYYLKPRGFKRRLLWSRILRRGFKRFYKFSLSKDVSKLKGFHFRLMLRYYRKKGLRKVLWEGIYYARLKRRLARYRKVFKSKDNSKKLVRKTSRDREEKLLLIRLLIHSLISRGKKKLSLKIFVYFLTLLKFRYKVEFFSKYEEALEKIRPLIAYKTMYIGGKKYKIPVIMPLSKSYATAIRWLISSSYSREFFPIALANNLFSAIKGEGAIIKQRKEFHLLSFENKTYIRFLRFLKSGF